MKNNKWKNKIHKFITENKFSIYGASVLTIIFYVYDKIYFSCYSSDYSGNHITTSYSCGFFPPEFVINILKPLIALTTLPVQILEQQIHRIGNYLGILPSSINYTSSLYLLFLYLTTFLFYFALFQIIKWIIRRMSK